MAENSSATRTEQQQQTQDKMDAQSSPNAQENEDPSQKSKKVTFAPERNTPEDHINQVNFFMDPMFAELEKHVKKNTDILDKLNKEMEEERKTRIKEQQTAHIPEPLKGSGQEMSDIMKNVEELIFYGECDDEDNKSKRKAQLQTLDIHGQAVITAHSVAAYTSTLDEANLRRFTTKITSDCQLWLSRLFRFKDSSVVFHEEERDGLVKICRLALYQKYPKYATEGFEALYSRPPVFYLSAACKPGLSSYICLQLGLPMSCICTVPCNTMFGSSSKMDVAVLEKLIQDDIAAAKTPVLLVAYSGTPQLGHVDNLQRLQEICKTNSIWLHVEGNSLATLATVSVPTSVEPAKSGDSMTICLGKWLGLPALPHATLFKASDPALVHASGLNTFNSQLKLNCLPLWICLQSLGHDGILERVKASCKLAECLYEELKKIKTIKQVGQEKKEDKSLQQANSLRDLISRAINALLVFEIITPTVVFRYGEDQTTTGVDIAPYSLTTTEEEQNEKDYQEQYYDALNIWLGETLMEENPNVDLQIIEVEKEGICIRFSPLESAQVRGTTKEDITNLIKSLKTQTSILDSTVLHQEQFRVIVNAQDNLRQLDMPTWAGLGVVQYIPDSCMDKLDNLTAQRIHEINTINIELVHRLKSMDIAFSLGYTSDELACCKFGLITEDTDIEELIGIVYTVGKEVEESSKYLEKMSEIIRKGIEEANQDLTKENQDKLIQEGVLRQVPLVGSLLNWWSPPDKNFVKGRTFDLSSGKIISTETTYKYHMQVQEDVPPQSPSPRSKEMSYKSNLKPVSPGTKTAAEVKADLTHTFNEPSSPQTASPQQHHPDIQSTQSIDVAVEVKESQNSNIEHKTDIPVDLK